jgi:four helix bundle protein
MGQSYLDLRIYKESLALFTQVHRFTMRLPKYELYELGSQLRRSADSVNSNIVEGYGRRTYKRDFIRFLVFSHASNLETVNHLRKLALLYADHCEVATQLAKSYDELGKQISGYINYVNRCWKT